MSSRARRRRIRWLAVVLLCVLAKAPLSAGLEEELGRNDTRVYSARFTIVPGLSVGGAGLVERLEARDYRRVGGRPGEPGQFFWGRERFWIFRRGLAGELGSALFRLDLDPASGTVTSIARVRDERESPVEAAELEPRLLAESLGGRRARRLAVSLDDLPERVWRPFVAIEDARFFSHPGVDARGTARALLKNLRAGRVSEGGSTITQQLVKMRDLTPRRTLGRKVSEAARAVSLEVRYSKREILEAYLNALYFGHIDGIALYGIEAASRAFFARSAQELTLAQAATLAAVVQGPNRLSPVRNAAAAAARRDLVLRRLEELEWFPADQITRAGRSALGVRRGAVVEEGAWGGLLTWIDEVHGETRRRRAERGRGVVAFTGLDAWLQGRAEGLVEDSLRGFPSSGRPRIGLVALDASTGDVIAYVGIEDRGTKGSDFDVVRSARRQPGSTIKPLLLLEAFEDCGPHDPLFPARLVSDRPLLWRLPSGEWRPRNPDGANRELVSLRGATLQSLNVPFARLGRWCGLAATASRLRDLGLQIDEASGPAFLLGSQEVSPLELVAAYTPIENGGRWSRPRPFERLLNADGEVLVRRRVKRRRVVSAASAWLVRDVLHDNLERGLGRPARLESTTAFGKTGTSSARRDAWFVGGAEGVVAAVWIGYEDNRSLRAGGATLAAPLWRELMRAVAASRVGRERKAPRQVVEAFVDRQTGLRVGSPRRGEIEVFRRGHLPPRRRLFFGKELPPIE